MAFVPPPLPFCFFFRAAGGGVWFSALSSRGVVLSVAGCPCLGSRGLCPPFPSRSGCVFVFLLLFFCPSLPQRGVCWRVRGVLSSSGTLHSVGCRRFWLGGPPMFLRGAPWLPSSVLSGWGVCPPLVVWVGGFVAVGLSRAPPPLFFRGGVCLFLPLPSLACCTHWLHSVWLTGLLLVLAFCWALHRPHGSRGLCTYDFSSCFLQKFGKKPKRGFSRKMTYFFGFYGLKIGGGPPTQILSKDIKRPDIWPILGYFCLLWAGPAEQCCTPVYLPIEDFRQKFQFPFDSLPPK